MKRFKVKLNAWSFSLLMQCILIYCVVSAKKKESSLTREFIEKEKKNLLASGSECVLKKLSQKSLYNLRLTKPVDISIPCYLRVVEENINDGWAWSVVAALYKKKGSNSQASTSFKIASKILGKVSPFVEMWYFIGPFVIGKMELDGDPLEAYGGVRNVSKYRYQKTEKFYSELVPGGEIKWSVYKQTHAGQMIKVAPNINWNDLVSSLGSMGITEWQGWIVGEFAVNEKDLNLIIRCMGVHTVYVNDIPLTGDVYHRQQYWSGVHLSQGIHTIYIKLRTKVAANFDCSIEIAKSAFQVHNPHFIPDLVNGFLVSQYVAFPMSNYHHTKWVKVTKVTITDQDEDGKVKVRLLKSVTIAPGQTLPVILKFSSLDRVMEKCKDDAAYSLEFRITSSDGIIDSSIKFRCRSLYQSFLFTFIDHDGSLQHAAAIPPIKSCDTKQCPVVLTLHGTTVPPQNQADSYKRMAEGEYVFGVDNAWLLAPTRHGAHNWEGPGALTALQSLNALNKMVEDSDDIFKVKVDTNKVVYAGHSMGGHGAWHLATHYPDKALALLSLAGWIKKEEYGDSNLFFRHDIATSHADPVTKFIMESCISENDADRHISNIQELPVLTRIGADDRTVHPFFLRRMYRLLAEIGIMVNHTELARKEHWWWDTWKTNDGGAVNDPQLRDFTNKFVSKSLEGGSQCDSIHGEEDCGKSEFDRYSQNSMTKREFTLTTYNPALGDGMNGLRVIQQITPLRKSEVHCTVGENTVEIDTVNVAKFSIEKTRNRQIKWSDKSVKINKRPVEIEIGNDISYLCYKSGHWSVCSGIEDTERGPDTYGPARRIAEQEFVIVVGTQSSNQTITELLLQSAVYIANLFFLTSDTIAPILKDEDIQTSDERNLILLGGPDENLHTTFFLEKLPITFKDGTLTIESCTYHHDRQGLMTLAPHHGNRLAMILLGSSPSGFLDVVSLATPTIPPMTRSPFSNLLPDYVLTGPDFGMKGPGGFLCTGFYGNRWEYIADTSSCVCL